MFSRLRLCNILDVKWRPSSIYRVAGTAVIVAVLTACGASTPAPTAAESSSSSAAQVASNASKAAEELSAVYGTSRPPTTTAAPTTSAATSATGEFTRTWSKDYAKTTCTEFMTVMTGQQGLVAAADMLVNARQGTDPSLPMPSNDLITMFQNDIQSGCGADGYAKRSIVEVATAIILIDNKQNYLK